MCLFSKENKLVRAEEDIVCYKRLLPIFEKDGVKFITPYQLMEVPLEVIKGKADFKAEGDKEIRGFNNEYTICGGFIHTYAFLRDALEEIDMDGQSGVNCDDIVLQCIIPKGTYYLEGQDSFGHRGFASRKIRFTIDEESINKEVLESLIDERVENLKNFKNGLA